MHDHAQSKDDLTHNQALVLECLCENKTPCTAYALLDQLRDKGLRAPPQIYRALEKLIELGLVHKLDSLNAYVGCSQKQCRNSSVVAFSICDQCHKVVEMAGDSLSNSIQKLAQNGDFHLGQSILEMHGLCEKCQP